MCWQGATSIPEVSRNEGGLSDDGVLHVRGTAEGAAHAFSKLHFDAAVERRASVMQWGIMSVYVQLCCVCHEHRTVVCSCRFKLSACCAAHGHGPAFAASSAAICGPQ